MNKQQEALRLALEALEYIDRQDNDRDFLSPEECCDLDDAITAIREALEQPAQIDPSAGTQVSKVWWNGDKLMAEPIPLEKLYKEPQQPAQQQKSVAWVCYGWASDEKHAIDYDQHEIDAIPVGTLLYTFPPASKPWVGLTDKEIKRMAAPWFLSMYWPLCNTFARAIEAKLKEKNA